MILYDTSGSEADPNYQSLAISNGERQFSFLQSIIGSAVSTNHTFLSQSILKALNFHAIACLHTNAGEYRPCPVHVKDDAGAVTFSPVDHYRVDSLMDNFINYTNSIWHQTDPIVLAAFVLWRLCNIHPFINGNGRSARAASYYVVCVKAGGLLPGTTFLPSLLKQSPDYVPALRAVDASATAGLTDVSPVQKLIADLLAKQVASAAPNS